MAFKLGSFLLFCNIVFANGHLLFRKNQHGSLNSPKILSKDALTQFKSYDTRTNNVRFGNDYAEFTTEEITSVEEQEGTVPVNQESIEPNILRECLQGQSSYTQQDLVLLIEHFTAEMKLIDSINESYFDLAITTRDKHAETLQDFFTKFGNRPKHLEHILDEITQIRINQIEPLANEVHSSLQDISVLEEVYFKKQSDAKIYFDKLERTRKICSLTCDSEILEYRAKRSIVSSRSLGEEQYYCATLKELKEIITNVLSTFLEECTEILKNQVLELDHVYEENIKEVISEMKEKTVKEFGATMYNVLSLQDEYYHFLNTLKGENVQYNVVSQLGDIRKMNLQIDYNIRELSDNVEKYRKYCLDCKMDENSRYRRDVSQTDFIDSPPVEVSTLQEVSPNTDETILKHLINTEVNEIKNNFENEIFILFDKINYTVNNKDAIIEKALANLQPLQEATQERLKREEQELDNLKSLAPKSALNDLSKLNANSNNLLTMLDDALQFIADTTVHRFN